jgi:hypothetical protein
MVTQSTKSQGFHSTLWYLAREHLVQMLQGIEAAPEVVAIKPGQL